jgi:hypothetical protein
MVFPFLPTSPSDEAHSLMDAPSTRSACSCQASRSEVAVTEDVMLTPPKVDQLLPTSESAR